MVLKRALEERWPRWGRDFVDPDSFNEPRGRNGQPLGVRVYTGYVAEFDLRRLNGSKDLSLVLTVDTKAKVEQSVTIHDILEDINRSGRWTHREKEDALRELQGASVLTSYDKRNFTIFDIEFDEICDVMKIPGQKITHAEYFAKNKKIRLKYPKDPLIQTKGRNDMKIFLPPELLHTTELSVEVKSKLPQIAGFVPHIRSDCVKKFTKFLEPGAQKTKGLQGLLPGVGIRVSSRNIPVNVLHMPIPLLKAKGVQV